MLIVIFGGDIANLLNLILVIIAQVVGKPGTVDKGFILCWTLFEFTVMPIGAGSGTIPSYLFRSHSQDHNRPALSDLDSQAIHLACALQNHATADS